MWWWWWWWWKAICWTIWSSSDEPWEHRERVDNSATLWRRLPPLIADPVRRTQNSSHARRPTPRRAVSRRRSACGPASSPCWSGTPERRRLPPAANWLTQSPAGRTNRQHTVADRNPPSCSVSITLSAPHKENVFSIYWQYVSSS